MGTKTSSSAVPMATPGDPRHKRRADADFRRAYKRRLGEILRLQTQGFAIHDARGLIIEANPAAEAMLGRSRAELIGTLGFQDTWVNTNSDGTEFGKDDYPANVALRTGRTQRGRVLCVRKSPHARQCWMLVDAIPQFANGTREPSEVFVFFTDFTRQHHSAELAQQDLSNQLAHVQRTELLGTLAGGIVHDLNNTLVPIIALSSDLLSRGLIEPATQESLELICKSGGQARDLVRRILMLARRAKPNKEKVDLCDLASEEARLLRSTLPANIALREMYGAPSVIWGDRAQLNQIVVNLIVNSAHAIGENRGEISLEVKKICVNNRDCIELTVTDTGCGMDAFTLERVFEPFYSTKAENEGTGLGLSVVQGIVRSHGGVISLKSSPNNGTHFAIQFPACDEDFREARDDSTP